VRGLAYDTRSLAAGLDTDSWHALLSSLKLNNEIVHIQDQQRGCTGLTAEVRHAELARDRELALTLKVGMAIRHCEGYPLRLNGSREMDGADVVGRTSGRVHVRRD
jgi:hypothetical protein